MSHSAYASGFTGDEQHRMGNHAIAAGCIWQRELNHLTTHVLYKDTGSLHTSAKVRSLVDPEQATVLSVLLQIATSEVHIVHYCCIIDASCDLVRLGPTEVESGTEGCTKRRQHTNTLRSNTNPTRSIHHSEETSASSEQWARSDHVPHHQG